MPIRLNLLAEAQAVEELRRKDPVKRVAWAAVVLVVLMLVWSSSLQLKAMMAGREVSKRESLMASFTNDYQQVLDNQKKVAEVRHKILALNEMSTNRLLQASLLNALQKTTVDDVQLMRYHVEQTYSLSEEVKSKTTSDGRVVPAKPAVATEHVTIGFDGSDASPNPGDQVAKLKEVLLANPYFRGVLGKSNAFSLKNLTAPEFSPFTGKRGVNFTLEGRLPEKAR
jgi:hypothetical protein